MFQPCPVCAKVHVLASAVKGAQREIVNMPAACCMSAQEHVVGSPRPGVGGGAIGSGGGATGRPCRAPLRARTVVISYGRCSVERQLPLGCAPAHWPMWCSHAKRVRRACARVILQ